jgi:hypothetical protein
MLPYLQELQMNPGANDGSIGGLVEWAGSPLPSDYVELLRYSDGAEGPIGESAWLILNKSDEIPELTDLAQLTVFGTNLVAIGTNGSSKYYAIRLPSNADEAPEFVQIDPYLDVDEAIEYRTSSLLGLLQHIAEEGDDSA